MTNMTSDNICSSGRVQSLVLWAVSLLIILKVYKVKFISRGCLYVSLATEEIMLGSLESES